jgi:two-component system response regulator (stage 0 sporulation protein F)
MVNGEKFRAPQILVVDDEPLIRWAVAERLACAGYTVFEAGDGKTALKYVARDGPALDLVLLDLRLPDSADLRVLEGIKFLRPHTKVILMTAYGRLGLGAEAVEKGAVRVIAKPFDVNDVKSAIDEALATPAA